MIFITGDTHGNFQRFSTDYFPQQKQMGRDDYAIVAGDFGGVFDSSPRESYWFDWLEKNRLPLFLWMATTRASPDSTPFQYMSGTAGRSTMSGLM